MRELRLLFEQPPLEVGPNGRLHWAKKARVVKGLRVRSRLVTQAVVHANAEFEGFCPSVYDIEWYYTYGGAPDADGVIGRCKALLDGGADALGVDDGTWDVGRVIRTKVGAKDPFSGKVVLIFRGKEACGARLRKS